MDAKVKKLLVGPVTFDVKVHVANDEDSVIGAVTVGLAPGKPVTHRSLLRAIGQALEALPDGYRLLSGDEFFNKVLVKEKTGRTGNFATPAGFGYDPEQLAADARAALAAKEPQ